MSYLRNWHGLPGAFTVAPAEGIERASDTAFDYIVLMTDMIGRGGTPDENYGMCGPMHGLFADPAAALRFLFDNQYLYLYTVTDEERISARFNVSQLKALCEKYGLKKTGKRDELIARLIDDGHREDFLDRPPWTLVRGTETGLSWANALFQYCFKCEADTFLALQQGKLEKAYEICAGFEKRWHVGSRYEVLMRFLSNKAYLAMKKADMIDLSNSATFIRTRDIWDGTQLDYTDMLSYIECGCPSWFIPSHIKKDISLPSELFTVK